MADKSSKLSKLVAASEQNHPAEFTRSLGKRSFVLHKPPGYDGSRPTPLVIVLHGGLGNAKMAMKMTGMSAKADKEDFLVAYPQGTGMLQNRLLTWNAGRCCGYAMDHKVDDVGFIRQLIAHLRDELNIDSKKIFMAGMSNGAMMAYRLACELSEIIAAIAPVAGSLDVEHCHPSDPVSVIAFHGLKDQRVRFEGGEPLRQADWHQREDLSVAIAMSFWIRHNDCRPDPDIEETETIRREIYSGGKNNTEIVLYALREQGHAWPGGEKIRAEGDDPSREISATDLMWEFFVNHPKP